MAHRARHLGSSSGIMHLNSFRTDGKLHASADKMGDQYKLRKIIVGIIRVPTHQPIQFKILIVGFSEGGQTSQPTVQEIMI